MNCKLRDGMKYAPKDLWKLVSPIANRLINFMVLPFTLHYFTKVEFIQATYFVLISGGVGLIVTFGNSPRLLSYASNSENLSFKLYLRIVGSFFVIWIPILGFLYILLPKIVPTSFVLPSNYVFLAVLEGLVYGLTLDAVSVMLQGLGKYDFLSNANFILTLLLGPFRVALLVNGYLDLTAWLYSGFVIRIFFFMYMLCQRNLFNQATGEQKKSFTFFGKWNAYAMFPIIFWVTSNFDRLVAPRVIGVIDAASYQVAFQCTSIVGLLLGQSIFLRSNSLASRSKSTRQDALFQLLEESKFMIIVSAPFILIIYRLLIGPSIQNTLKLFFLLLVTQYIWALLHLVTVYVSSGLGMSHVMPLYAGLALVGQLVIFKFQTSYTQEFLALLVLGGHLISLFFILVTNFKHLKNNFSAPSWPSLRIDLTVLILAVANYLIAGYENFYYQMFLLFFSSAGYLFVRRSVLMRLMNRYIGSNG